MYPIAFRHSGCSAEAVKKRIDDLGRRIHVLAASDYFFMRAFRARFKTKIDSKINLSLNQRNFKELCIWDLLYNTPTCFVNVSQR